MIIGYGSDAKADEKDTFIELISKHRGSADVVHPGMDDRVDVFTVSSFEDVRQISQTLRSYLSREGPL